jgi:hypothetical protein
MSPVDRFEPAIDVAEWIVATFIADDGAIANPDHQHLQQATIAVLWTNIDHAKAMRVVIGQAELMPPQGMGKWQRARSVQQMADWFGGLPDFLITLSATAAAEMDDTEFCALVEHELYHCVQALDRHGAPKFSREGAPVWAIRGHDVEEFVGVVARYGMTDPGVAALVQAANRGPSIGLAQLGRACGTCLRLVA